MAISVFDQEGFRNKLISHFIDGYSDQLDSCFAAFKRIDEIIALFKEFDHLIVNLQLTGKASIKIDSIDINFDNLHKMNDFYKNKEVDFIVEKFKLYYSDQDNISDEDAEFINKISPKILKIKNFMQTVESIKALALLNCINIDTYFCNPMFISNSYFCLINTPIQLFDSKFDQRLTFKRELIKIFYFKNKITEIKLLKTNTGNFLFIPLDAIGNIFFSGFREILSVDNINKQFADLDFQLQFKDDGFIIPAGYSNKIFINLNDSYLDYLNQIKQKKILN